MNKDQRFDKLLERTSRLPERPDAPGDCLDAEMLAAWSDGALAPATRAAAEAHAAGCDRCLAILGAMAQTAPLLSAGQKPGWFSLRWFVPLGAAAVAVIALVVAQRTPDENATITGAPAATERAEALPQRPVAKQDSEPATKAAADAFQDKVSTPDKLKGPKPEQLEKEQLQARTANESLRKDASRPPAIPSATAAATPRAEGDAATRFELRREAQKPARIIASSQSSIQWLIEGQSVRRSTDAGVTWEVQAAGATVDLLAGSSPSPTVCWIVGRSGTILLTTDGATWRRLPFPEVALDVVGVVATDHLSASVTTATGSVYRTVDGGVTWTLQRSPALQGCPRHLQENPAAPF